jgi:opacity protein-like surface antigen
MPRSGYGFGGRNRQSTFYKEAEKVGEITNRPKGERTMIKRLALLCCILLLPTIGAAQGTTNYGEFWVGGQVGALFTSEADWNFDSPFGGGAFRNVGTQVAVTAGGIVGYNFCMSYRQPWERYFGVALDFSWNQFTQGRVPIDGNQFALAFLARGQYPLMGSEIFKYGRLVPFIMVGPAIVWSNSDFSNLGGDSRTSTDVAIVAEIGLDYYIIPHLSIGPSFRYRHVFGPGYEFQNVNVDTNLNQFTLLARLAYHF